MDIQYILDKKYNLDTIKKGIKKAIFILPILALSLSFTACEMGKSKEAIALEQRELDIKELELQQKIKYQIKQFDAKLAMAASDKVALREIKEKEQELRAKTHELKEKELDGKLAQQKAELEKKQELEIVKIKYDLEKEKIYAEIKDKNSKIDLEATLKNNELELRKYMIIIGVVILFVLAGSAYVYFNNKRKDKLRAYQDNLDKYFNEKENQTKLHIANKILDTIADGKLNSQQENKLLLTMAGISQEESSKLLLTNNMEELPIELEEIDSNKKKKKKKKKKKSSEIIIDVN